MDCKDFKFEEIKIGDSVEFERVFCRNDMDNFAKLSGNFNPLHVDEKYAEKTEFKKPIVYGLLVASLLSGLIGMYLPGKRSLCLSQTLVYRNPVFIGDKLKVRGEVTAKSESTGIITLKTVIKNDKGIVLDGEAKVKIL